MLFVILLVLSMTMNVWTLLFLRRRIALAQRAGLMAAKESSAAHSESEYRRGFEAGRQARQRLVTSSDAVVQCRRKIRESIYRRMSSSATNRRTVSMDGMDGLLDDLEDAVEAQQETR